MTKSDFPSNNPLNVGQVLVERLKRFTENMDSKPWTTLLGKPQGNEMVVGKEIIRQVIDQYNDKDNLYKAVNILWKFDSDSKAKEAFDIWIKENKQ